MGVIVLVVESLSTRQIRRPKRISCKKLKRFLLVVRVKQGMAKLNVKKCEQGGK